MPDLLQLQNDPAAFRAALVIDATGQPKPFADCLDDWQRADFTAMDAGWRRAAGQEVTGNCQQRAWLERPRGHSKSSDVMTMAVWCLFASRKRLSGVVVACDRDQAAINRDHAARLLACNPWLNAVIEVTQWRITNRHTGSSMDVMASDVASSYGLLLDFACCDEVTLWPKRDLFDSILSAVAKRSTCLLLCIGNAGFQDSPWWHLRESIRKDLRWYFNALPGCVASWITPADLDEQQRLLPPAAFARLWSNVWSGAGGDALSAEAIAMAFRAELRPQDGAVLGFEYVAGVDLGVSRDASAVCVLGVRRSHDGHGKIQLAHTRLWRPTPGCKVDLQEVEDCIRHLHGRFRFRQLNYDPWQATHMASRLQSAGLGKLVHGRDRQPMLSVVEIPPTGKHLQAQATALLEAFNDGRVELFEQADLRRDLTRLRVVEKSYGLRLESPRDEHGHGDLASAFCLAMLAATERAAKKRNVIRCFCPGEVEDDSRPMGAAENVQVFRHGKCF